MSKGLNPRQAHCSFFIYKKINLSMQAKEQVKNPLQAAGHKVDPSFFKKSHSPFLMRFKVSPASSAPGKSLLKDKAFSSDALARASSPFMA